MSAGDGERTGAPPRVEGEFDGGPASVRRARAFVEAALAAWDVDDLSEVAVLLTSEVAANAVLHARSVYRLALELRGGPEVRIEVADRSERLPRVRLPALDAEGGRGLDLLDRLAASWGSEPVAGGKAVWFTVRRPAARPFR